MPPPLNMEATTLFYKAISPGAMIGLLLLSFLTVTPARANNPTDHTRLTVEGQILDTPCSIDPGSRDQSVSMGATPVGVIAREGSGRRIPFSIRLLDCTLARADRRLPDWKGLSITFDGVADGRDFAVSGPAGGVALRITDADGHPAIPGKPLPDRQIVQGDQMLTFTLQLVSNRRALVKGDYRAVINFGISYF